MYATTQLLLMLKVVDYSHLNVFKVDALGKIRYSLQFILAEDLAECLSSQVK